MIDGMFNATAIPVLEQAMKFAQARHNVLAGNIANLDTPGYKSQDLSPEKFADRLKTAIAARDESYAASVSDESSPTGGTLSMSSDPISDATAGLDDLLYHDQSTGSLEKQVAAIAKNQMQHNVAVSVLSSQFRLLQTAISERV